MECWIHLFSLCVFDPSNVVLEGDVSRQIGGDFAYHSGAQNYGGGTLGRLSVYDVVPISKHWTVTYGITHESLLDTRSDPGQERFSVGFVWRPFSR